MAQRLNVLPAMREAGIRRRPESRQQGGALLSSFFPALVGGAQQWLLTPATKSPGHLEPASGGPAAARGTLNSEVWAPDLLNSRVLVTLPSCPLNPRDDSCFLPLSPLESMSVPCILFQFSYQFPVFNLYLKYLRWLLFSPSGPDCYSTWIWEELVSRAGSIIASALPASW